MTIKRQRDIKFINDCGCKVDFGELADAIKWKQISPTLAIKHINPWVVAYSFELVD